MRKASQKKNKNRKGKVIGNNEPKTPKMKKVIYTYQEKKVTHPLLCFQLKYGVPNLENWKEEEIDSSSSHYSSKLRKASEVSR